MGDTIGSYEQRVDCTKYSAFNCTNQLLAKDRTPNALCIDFLILSTTRTRVTSTSYETTQRTWLRHGNQQELHALEVWRNATGIDAILLEEYFISLIICKAFTLLGRKDVEMSYGYGQSDGIIELPHHIPLHFITRYQWLLTSKQQQTSLKQKEDYSTD